MTLRCLRLSNRDKVLYNYFLSSICSFIALETRGAFVIHKNIVTRMFFKIKLSIEKEKNFCIFLNSARYLCNTCVLQRCIK